MTFTLTVSATTLPPSVAIAITVTEAARQPLPMLSTPELLTPPHPLGDTA